MPQAAACPQVPLCPLAYARKRALIVSVGTLAASIRFAQQMCLVSVHRHALRSQILRQLQRRLWRRCLRSATPCCRRMQAITGASASEPGSVTEPGDLTVWACILHGAAERSAHLRGLGGLSGRRHMVSGFSRPGTAPGPPFAAFSKDPLAERARPSAPAATLFACSVHATTRLVECMSVLRRTAVKMAFAASLKEPPAERARAPTGALSTCTAADARVCMASERPSG